MSAVLRVGAAELLAFARAVLERKGVPPEDAGLAAEALVATNLRGVDSHGINRLPEYVARLERGLMQAVTRLTPVASSPPLELWDGQGGVGPVVASRTMERAVALARDHGVGVVGVRRSNHFGAAGHYALMAAARGLIGLAATNAAPTLAPWGGREARLGNNPWAIAVPCRTLGHPLLLDIANSVSSFGKLRQLAEEGRPIPEGWVMTADGRPTTDPREALSGVLLPMGGHKGYAISFMIEVLAGALTGAGCPGADPDGGGVGHLMAAVGVTAFATPEEFEARLGRVIKAMKTAPLAPGHKEVMVPGEVEARNEAERRRAGIPLPAPVVERLVRLGEGLGVSFPSRGGGSP
ncbi:MAG: Ldh family oxidoreductase [Acetobacteraceae bacterium]|nr:Ldh family oxidoreductase [Acetobacteraceae bacterium]